jgi:branched-chain amino acid aminotransferase
VVDIQPLSKIWQDGALRPWNDAKVHVLSHGLHYGYAIFEGIRTHATPEGPAIFRLGEHIDRFLDSAKIYRMKIPFSRAELLQACQELVAANGIADAYLRPIAFSGYGAMGLDPTRCKTEVAIGEWAWEGLFGAAARTGVRATVSSWTRIDSRSLPPQAKCAANYANGALAKLEAAAGGFDEAILLNSAGMVAEGTGENIFRVKNGHVTTPPASAGILRGITRDTVIHVAREERVPVDRDNFTREDLFTADELFFSGTAAGIVPVREVDGRPIGSGRYPITERLRQRYDALVHGAPPTPPGWLTPVGAPAARAPAPSPAAGPGAA